MLKYGFVYIWYNKIRKMYYIGSHWGKETDTYICSSRWMRNDYRRHPQNFKRRILKTNIPSKKEQFEEEQHYLQMIKKEELGKRYYNLNNTTYHWSIYDEKIKTIGDKISINRKGKYTGKQNNFYGINHKGENNPFYGHKHLKETIKKMSKPKKEEFCEMRRIMILGTKQSEETKLKRSNSLIKFYEEKRGRPALPKSKIKRGSPEWIEKVQATRHNYHWITNSIESKLVLKTDSIPEGWRKGRACCWKPRNQYMAKNN